MCGLQASSVKTGSDQKDTCWLSSRSSFHPDRYLQDGAHNVRIPVFVKGHIRMRLHQESRQFRIFSPRQRPWFNMLVDETAGITDDSNSSHITTRCRFVFARECKWIFRRFFPCRLFSINKYRCLKYDDM